MIALPNLTLIDLFSGCGGISRGFVDADARFRPVLAVEHEVPEASTYSANFPEARVFCGDIAKLSDEAVPLADVVVGGPPCQGFSGLGKRDPDDDRNKLWREYVRVVRLAQPRVFVVENVARFFASPDFQLFKAELDTGSLTDYEYVYGVLRAEDFGVPQRRHRAFVIASRVGSPTLPTPTHHPSVDSGLMPRLTVRDALKGIDFEPTGTALPSISHPFAGHLVPGPFAAEQVHIGRNYRDESIRRYDAIGPGRGRLDLPYELQFECWRRKPKGTTDVLGRLEWAGQAATIRTEFFKPEKGRYLHPQWDEDPTQPRMNRAITHWEAARLQTFPDLMLWCGTKVEIARQIGNAVPPLLASAIALQSVLPLLEIPEGATEELAYSQR